jgi:hypothetical protein
LVTGGATALTRPTISWPGTMGNIAPRPLVARLVDVGVADAAVQHVDHDVVRAGLAAVDGEGRERRARSGGTPGLDFGHARVIRPTQV